MVANISDVIAILGTDGTIAHKSPNIEKWIELAAVNLVDYPTIGGVAHDFNNLLTTIIGYSELILMNPDLDEATIEGVQEISNSAHSGAALTQQLLAFSRKQVAQPTALNLNHLIKKHGTMLRRLVGEDIVVVTKLDTDLGLIHADPGQSSRS